MKYLTPVPKQFVDQSGVPYSGGKVSVYVTGSTDFAEIYLDADGETLAPNPARLDSNGSWICFVSPDQVLDYVVQDKDDHVVATYEKVVVGGGSGEVGGWLGNLTVAEVNALESHKKGDSATLLDAGTVMPGNVTVDVGDDIMWVDSLGVWQPKITDHLHHDETLVGTGSANDPLGVNPETIEDNILRMRYRGGGRLKFWRINPLPTT